MFEYSPIQNETSAPAPPELVIVTVFALECVESEYAMKKTFVPVQLLSITTVQLFPAESVTATVPETAPPVRPTAISKFPEVLFDVKASVAGEAALIVF
jgi:hypothetical protein